MNPKTARKLAPIIVILLLGGGLVFGFRKPVYGAGMFLSLDVNSRDISFSISNPENPLSYYECSKKIAVTSTYRFATDIGTPWYLGIRASSMYLADYFNPSRQIPITSIRWSRDGVNFYRLTNQWTLVNTYPYNGTNRNNRDYTENITYRFYIDGGILPAGDFTVQVEYDVRWTAPPWN